MQVLVYISGWTFVLSCAARTSTDAAFLFYEIVS